MMFLVVALVPGTLGAHSGVQVESHEDEMGSWTYAYVSADRGPLRSMDDRGLVFDRSPHLIFICFEGAVDVVYLFDTELIGEEGAVLVQSRFDSHQASDREAWPLVSDLTSAAEVEAAVAALGVDKENPFLDMFGGMSIAARLSGEDVEVFLEAARGAEQVTMRVTDQLDGESYTDVFSLEGLAKALEQIRATCGS
jgi:hypothetical protein